LLVRIRLSVVRHFGKYGERSQHTRVLLRPPDPVREFVPLVAGFRIRASFEFDLEPWALWNSYGLFAVFLTGRPSPTRADLGVAQRTCEPRSRDPLFCFEQDPFCISYAYSGR